MENFIHELLIENRRKLSVTQAKEVLAFSEKELKLKLKDGGVLLVFGEALKITAFDEISGNFTAVGNVLGVRYKGANENLLKKVFK